MHVAVFRDKVDQERKIRKISVLPLQKRNWLHDATPKSQVSANTSWGERVI